MLCGCYFPVWATVMLNHLLFFYCNPSFAADKIIIVTGFSVFSLSFFLLRHLEKSKNRHISAAF